MICAVMHILFKFMWKMIMNKMKEYLSAQPNTLQQNTRNKEKKLKISANVRKTANWFGGDEHCSTY